MLDDLYSYYYVYMAFRSNHVSTVSMLWMLLWWSSEIYCSQRWLWERSTHFQSVWSSSSCQWNLSDGSTTQTTTLKIDSIIKWTSPKETCFFSQLAHLWILWLNYSRNKKFSTIIFTASNIDYRHLWSRLDTRANFNLTYTLKTERMI